MLPMTSSDADAELMLRVKNGDTDAFRELVERHQRAVINTIYRAIGDRWEAEDLAQRVFVQVFRSAKRYKPTAKFTTWLHTIVHNTVRNEYRRRSRRAAESLDAMQNPTASDPPSVEIADARAQNPAREVAERELQQKIRAAIQQLPDAQRTAVILCRFEGCSYEEIAKILGGSASAVKSLLHRARETLKNELKGLY
jgi:RNA polymerase sigma-70 factor (ECF subfamily)